jgi:lactoylglutathione lyase
MASVVGAGLNVTNLERSIRFYQGIGMSSIAHFELAEFNEVAMAFEGSSGSATLMLVERPEHAGSYVVGDGFDRILIRVDDIQNALASVLACEGSIEADPIDRREFGVTLAIVRDPDGYRIELLQAI